MKLGEVTIESNASSTGVVDVAVVVVSSTSIDVDDFLAW